MRYNRNSRRFFAWCVALLILAGPTGRVEAHPHVWVDYRVKAIGNKSGITKLRFTWRFDAMFSQLIREDKNINMIGDKEIKILHDQVFSNLQNYHYYITAKLDGADFEPKKVEDFTARMHGKQLEYEFTVLLPKPAQNLELSLFDEEFYVDIGPPVDKIPAPAGGSFMAPASRQVQAFVTSASEDAAVAPRCEYQEGMPRVNKMWGNFTTFIVTCKTGG